MIKKILIFLILPLFMEAETIRISDGSMIDFVIKHQPLLTKKTLLSCRFYDPIEVSVAYVYGERKMVRIKPLPYEKVKVVFRFFNGNKIEYIIDKTKILDIPPNLFSIEITYEDITNIYQIINKN